jgi:hypothetical protein
MIEGAPVLRGARNMHHKRFGAVNRSGQIAGVKTLAGCGISAQLLIWLATIALLTEVRPLGLYSRGCFGVPTQGSGSG